MEQLETMETKKRRMPKVRTMLLAAALAVGCLLSIAAAANLPGRVYNFLTGGQVRVMPDMIYGSMTVGGGEAAPVKAEDGRLWLEVDGQRLDITDKVDENTPYIYERTDPVTGEKGLMVVGGTVEDFGWIEYFIVDGEMKAGSGYNFISLTEFPDGSADESGEGSTISVVNGDEVIEVSGVTGRIVNRPWYQAALDQLGFEG